MNTVAIIPARGGSKGIPGKNLRSLNGKTLVEWSIFHALQSKYIERVIVSTDSEEIREVALKAGAEVPFLRPKELSGDLVLDLPVFEHALLWLKMNEGYTPEIMVHLRPTAPYREEGWIDDAILLLNANAIADSVRSVSLVTQHPYRMFEIASNGLLSPIMAHRHPNPSMLRRQDLPEIYYYNCVIDVTRAKTITELESMTGKNILPWIMPAELVIDIDTPKDFAYAEWFLGNLKT